MTVTVCLKSLTEPIILRLEENATVSDALIKCEQLPTKAGLKVISGRAVGDTEKLKDGDILEIYPSIVGG